MDAVGVVLMALGLGLAGWVVQRRRHRPPRQLANWIQAINGVTRTLTCPVVHL